MKTISLEATSRSEFGKGAARKSRVGDKVPGVMYGRTGAQAVHVSVAESAMRPLVYTPDFQLVDLNVQGDKTYRCVLKNLQFDKVSDQLIHFDLLELQDDKKVIVSIPLKFEGTPAGVRVGGKLIVKMKALNVRAYPKDLREFIPVNIEDLQLNGNIRVEDIKAENCEILNSPRIPVISVVLTRQLKQQSTEAKKEESKKAAEEKK